MRTGPIALILTIMTPLAFAQQGYDPAARIAVQKEAMAKLEPFPANGGARPSR